jgi:hypothetical protein
MRKGESLIKEHPSVGKRVEIHPGSDTWMRGARYGKVKRVVTRGGKTEEIAEVRMDHPRIRNLHRQYVGDLREVHHGRDGPHFGPQMPTERHMTRAFKKMDKEPTKENVRMFNSIANVREKAGRKNHSKNWSD